MTNTLNHSALEGRNLADKLAHLLRGQILSQEIAAGEPLRQDVLAARFGVSKIPLREACGRLEQEGLLSSRANCGWWVRDLDLKEAAEIFSLRLSLEPATAGKAAELASKKDQRLATQALRALDTAIDLRLPTIGELNRSFHLALARPSDSPITISILERLHIIAERYVRAHLSGEEREARAHAEHAVLLEAWLRRDSKKVRTLLKHHIYETARDLRRELK
jgi:DNA-binding GntR family transcriptional regulator